MAEIRVLKSVWQEENMTGNESMFYFSLGAFLILLAGYLPVRIWIELQKRKVKNEMSDENEWKRCSG